MKWKFIFLSSLLFVSSLHSADMPNDYDRFVMQKISVCDKDIQLIENLMKFSVCPEYTQKDPSKALNETDRLLIYLKGKRDAYSEFLYELD